MKIINRKCALGGVVIVAAASFVSVPSARPADQPEKKIVLPLNGRIEAAEQTRVYARVPGFVRQMNVDLGDRVKKGQVLAELSVPEVEAELKRKEALVARAAAEVEGAKHGLAKSTAALDILAALVKEAEAAVRAARAKLDAARAALDRAKRLVESKTIDVQLLEEKLYEVELAKATVEEAESKVQTAKAAREAGVADRAAAEIAVKAAEAQLAVAKADRERTAIQLSYAKAVAPFDGVITRRTADTGALAGPPDARGEPLFIVTRTNPVRFVVAVTEANAVARMRAGADAVVQVRGQEYKAKVSRVGGMLDPSNESLRVEIDLPNPDGKLLPGMRGTVTITLGKD